MGDFFRFFALSQGLVVMLLTLMIVVRYSSNLVKAKSFRTRVMPLHIVLIGTSYIILTIFVCMDLHAWLGKPLTYRVWFATVAFTLGDSALIIMLFHLFIEGKLLAGVAKKLKKDS